MEALVNEVKPIRQYYVPYLFYYVVLMLNICTHIGDVAGGPRIPGGHPAGPEHRQLGTVSARGRGHSYDVIIIACIVLYRAIIHTHFVVLCNIPVYLYTSIRILYTTYSYIYRDFTPKQKFADLLRAVAAVPNLRRVR